MDNNKNIEDLLERSYGSDLPILLKAKEDAKRRVRDDPSAANLAALDRAAKMLSDAVNAALPSSKTFPDAKAVLGYLQSSGRKISQSQLYKDLKRGYLRRQPDKSFRLRDVDAYAATLALVSVPEAKADEISDLAEEKLKEEVGKLREQRQSIAFDRQIKAGKYILREDVALELASRAVSLALSLQSVFRLNVADYIRMVGGDVGKAELLASEFENNLDMTLNEYSKPMDFRAEFIVDETSDETTDERPE